MGGGASEDTVPASEIAPRIAKFAAALAAGGMDAALIVDPTDLYYLSGTSQDAHLLVTADGDHALLVRRSFTRATRESPLDHIQALSSLRDLPRVLARAGIAHGCLGLELDVLPAGRYLRYAELLPNFKLTDCSEPVRRLRSIKSAWELAHVREAARQLQAATDAVPRVLVEGVTEIELAADIERLLRRAGHQGPVRARAFGMQVHYGTVVAGPSAAVPGGADAPIVGPGPNPAVGKGASHRPIRRGEPVIVDLVGAYGGYLADQTRTFSLGPVTEPFAQLHERARSILDAVAADARPATLGSSLYTRAWELAGNGSGFMGADGEQAVSFVGHGVGLELDEPPFLARGWSFPLEEGMVFALEPKFVVAGLGAVGIENTYAVTSKGVETVTTAAESLIEV